MPPRKLLSHVHAMLFAFSAFTGWVLVDAVIKWGSEATLSPYAIMAAIGLVGAVWTAGKAVAKGMPAMLRPVSVRAQLFICACSLVISYGNVIALKYMPLTLFYIIVLTAPLVVAALVSCLKHEKLTLVKIICLLAGFCGVVIAIAPRGGGGGAGQHEWIGYLAALIGTCCFAAKSIAIRRISATDNPLSIQFCSTLVIGIAGLLGCVNVPLPALGAVAALCGAGVLDIISNLIYSEALGSTAATNVAQLHYTQIVTGAIVGFLIWHEQPTASLVAGSLLIVGSGLWVAARAQKDSAAAVQPLA